MMSIDSTAGSARLWARDLLLASTALVGFRTRPALKPTVLHVPASLLRARIARLLTLAVETPASLLARLNPLRVRKVRPAARVGRRKLRETLRTVAVLAVRARGVLARTGLVVASLAVGTGMAQAQSSTWGGAGNPGATTTTGDYNLGTNWSTGTAPTAAGQSAVFAATGVPAVNVSAGPIAPDSWTFNTDAQNYTITGARVNFGGAGIVNNAAAGTTISIANVIGGAGRVQQLGAGTLTLTGANAYTGGTTVAVGRVIASNTGSAFGSSGTVAISSGATVELNNTTGATNNIDQTGTTFSGTGTLEKTGNGIVTIGQGTGAGASSVRLGSGGLIAVSAGTLRASAANGGDWSTNQGGLTVASGATFDTREVAVRVDGLNGGGVVLNNFGGSLTVGVAGRGGTFSGTIQNGTVDGTVGGSNAALALTKAGAGTQILTGANTYTGATTISGGILQIGNGGATGSLAAASAVTVASGATLALNRTGTLAFGNAVSGAGALTVSGGTAVSDLITLSGTLAQTGGFTVANAANVTIAATGSYVAAANGVVLNGGIFTNQGTVRVTGGGNGTNAVTTSTTVGTTVNNAAGAQIVGQASGVIQLQGGVVGALTVSNAGLIQGINYDGVTQHGTGALSITNTGTGVIYGQNAIGSQNGYGSGSDGGGKLTLTNDAGGRIVGQYGVVGSNATDTITNAGTIASGTYTAGAATPITLGGLAGIQLRAGGTVINQATGRIESAGQGVVSNAGSLIVTNAGTINSTLESGIFNGNGTLSASNTGTISGQNGIDANLTSAANITVTGNGTITGRAGFGVRAVSGTGNVVLGTTSAALGTVSGTSIAIRAATGGAGTVDVVAGGNVTAGGIGIDATANAGTVTVNTSTGTIQSGAAANAINATNAGGLITVNNAASLQHALVVTGGTAINAISSGTGGVTVANTGAISAAGGTFSNGIIAQATGGAGNVTVSTSVAGTIGSLTAPDSGIFATSSGSGNVAVTADGAIRAGNQGIRAYSQGTGTGSVSVTGAGTITTLAGGSIGLDAQIANVASAGTISVNTSGGVSTNTIGVRATTAGTGSVTATAGAITTTNGSGLVATGTSGVVAVTANGAIQAGGAGNAGVFLTGNNASNTVTVGAGGALPQPIVQGAIGLRLAGTGTTALVNNGTLATTGGAGANAVQIDGGTLVVGNTAGTLTGNLAVVNGAAAGNSTLTVDRTADLALANVVTGAGTLNKSGASLLTLTGVNSATNGQFTGTVNVGAGTLAVNGTLGNTAAVGPIAANSATVNVNTGATLHGTGTIAGSVVVNTGATVSAGNSPGTLTVAGNYTLNAGSTSLFELGAPNVVGGASNDLISVGGNLQLGGTLSLVSATNAAVAPVSGVYRLFDYGGALTGAFGTVLTPTGTTSTATVYTTVPRQVNLLIANAGGGGGGGGGAEPVTPVTPVNPGTPVTPVNPGTPVIPVTPVTPIAPGGQAVQFWDGADTSGAIAGVQGGSGTWSSSATNWTTVTGDANTAWRSGVGIFSGMAGVVTVAGEQGFQGLQFTTDGYALRGAGTLTLLGDVTSPTRSFVNVDAGVGATIANALTGATGAIGLNKLGSGTLTLTGASTYTGTTQVAAGTLVVAAGGALASAVTVDTGAILVNAGTLGAGLTNAGSASNSGTVAARVSNTGRLANTGTLNGGLVNATGTTTNAGTINGGATILGGSFTNTGSVSGALVNNGTIVTSGTLAGGLTNTGDVTALAGRMDGAVLNNAGTLSIAGRVAGNGTFANASAATLAVTGTYDLAGLLTNAGSLTVASGGALTAPAGIVNSGAIAVAQGGTITDALANTGRVVNDGTYNADVSNAGPGTIANRATGVWNGNLTANTASFMNAGLWQGNARNDVGGTLSNSGTWTTASAPIANAGTLSNTGTLNGGVANSGGFANAGTLNGGLNNIAGTTTNTGTINGAVTVTGGSLDTTGTINGALTNAAAVTASGRIAGSVTNLAGASFTLNGPLSGVTRLSNDGTFDLGGTALSVGSLSGTNIAAVLRNGTLTAASDDTTTYAGTITDGTAATALIKSGTGTLTLTGANTFTGGTTILSGTLVASAANLGGGPVTNNNTLVIDQAGDATLSDTINGTGRFIKRGAGSLTYTGTGTLSGASLVSAGRLSVNGSLANSVVTIATAASLGGTGVVGGVVANGGGTVAPGASPGAVGTLRVAGNVLFASQSLYQVDATASGQSDRIAVSGTATLQGGTVQVTAQPGLYAPSTRYTILTAAGGLTGRFANVTANFAFLTPTLAYGNTDVTLQLARNDIAFGTTAQTRNQSAVAAAAQATAPGARLYDAIAVLSAPQSRAAYDALSGEIHASAITAQFETATLIREAVLDRLRWGDSAGFGSGVGSQGIGQRFAPGTTVPAAYTADLPGRAPSLSMVPARLVDPQPITAWGQGFGAFGSTATNGNAARLDRQTSGFVLGADARVENDWRIGAAGGYTVTNLDITGRLSTGSVESGYGALYAGGGAGPLQVRLGASYGGNSLTTRRAVIFAGLGENASARYGGNTAQAFAETGYRFGTALGTVEPFLGGAVIRIGRNAFSETGGASALTAAGRDYDLATSTVGVRAEAQLGAVLGSDLPVLVRALVGYRRAYGDVVPSALLAFTGGQSFVTAGIPIDRDALVTQAGLDWQVARGTTLGVAYTGQVGTRAQDHGVKGNFTLRF